MEEPTVARPTLLGVVGNVRCGQSRLHTTTASVELGNTTTAEALMVMLPGASPQILEKKGNTVKFLTVRSTQKVKKI